MAIPTLSGSYIDETYIRLVQVSGSEFADGLGNPISFGPGTLSDGINGYIPIWSGSTVLSNSLLSQIDNLINVSGSVSASNGYTGSLEGTASWALNVLTASYIDPLFISASAASFGFGSGSSTTLNIDTGSFATTGSNIFTGSQTIFLTNSDYTNYEGTGSHIIFNNDDPAGQNVLSSYINGNLVAKWRTDYAGDINWVAGATGKHYFITQGDFGTGTVKMQIQNNGNVQIGDAGLNGTLPDTGYRLDVSGSGNFQQGLNVTGQFSIEESITEYKRLDDTAEGETSMFTFPASYNAIIGKYVVVNGSNVRAGQYMTAWTGYDIIATDTSTGDVGSTTDVVFNSAIFDTNVVISVICNTPGWTVKMLSTCI